MKKRLRFGLVIGAVVVMLAIVGFVGGHKFIGAASSLPGSNCTPSGDAVVDVTISNGAITSSLPVLSPGICYSFSVTNNDKQAYDFLIEQPGSGNSSTVLAAISNIAAGQQATVAYSFSDALTGTSINFAYTATGQQKTLGSRLLYLSE